MASRPPTADARSGSGGMSPAEFAQTLRDATASSQRHGLGPGTARIRDLRHALGGKVSRDGFEQGLRRLQHEGIVELVLHGHPELLTLSEVQDALPQGGVVFYLLRWLK